MARDYATPQPVDRFGNQVQPEQAAATPALVTNTSGALLSSMVLLDGRATVIEVATTGSGAAGIKWWGSVIGSDNIHPSMLVTNPDNVVPGNWIRRFVIPQSVAGISSTGSVIGGYGKQNGLYHQVTVMPLTASTPTSIVVTQY